MTVGGIDTYYDYEEQQWKFRRLGGGPVRRAPVCPDAEPERKDPTVADIELPTEVLDG